ncbi:MAG: 5-formyltetrahydrofolate cyclo-ligase [Leptospiraceae bacterium]|nr:5-formyltetrahydrofolate cyclo-ligase [Leptospiraceae bacterium]MCP5495861.1 5-formyltetrahydrofolate cyclo-ligase [Leptospiraceae bacterium]
MDSKPNKKEVRAWIKRELLQIQNRKNLENQVCQRLINLIGKEKKVILYKADKYEVDLEYLVVESSMNCYYFPKIISMEDKSLEFIKPQSWELGPYSIWQPIGNESILPKEADLCIVPALGFNKKGYRLGRGGGFYDRNLSEVSSDRLIGVSFSDTFPVNFQEDSYDIRVGIVVLENRLVTFDTSI